MSEGEVRRAIKKWDRRDPEHLHVDFHVQVSKGELA